MSEIERPRVVVITGGGGGIGSGMARAFAQNGDRVVLIGRHADLLQETASALGQQCSWQQADVGERDQVAAAIREIGAHFGKIDVLINNAGHATMLSADLPLAQAEEIWEQNIRTNLTGAFLVSYAAAPYITRPGGRIINISTAAALNGGAGLRTMGYVASKAGILGLTRAQAREYGPLGITVNAIAPGFIYGTPANRDVPEEVANGIAQHILVRRLGEVEDIVAAALYLASPQAGFITGEVINISGGR